MLEENKMQRKERIWHPFSVHGENKLFLTPEKPADIVLQEQNGSESVHTNKCATGDFKKGTWIVN